MTSDVSTRARVLVSGDSITRGKLGSSYVALLRTRFPQVDFVNLGQDGDTLSGIRRRTLEFLSKDVRFSFVVVVAGHNDIILPALTSRGSFYRLIPQQLARKGSIPARDLEEFVQVYREFISEVRKYLSCPLAISTLSSVNENAVSPTASLRLEYNEGIRTIARENQVILADVGDGFDQVLDGGQRSNYFMSSLFAPVTRDLWASGRAKALDTISKRRGLRLTIDGVHLNPRGARIYAEVLGEVVQRELFSASTS